MKIDIENPPSLSFQKIVKVAVAKFFQNIKLSPDTHVSIFFVSGAEIKKLNNKFRKINQSTDVLSFPVWENLDDMPKTGAVNLGDIFISILNVKKNALNNSVALEKELENITNHSLKHLIGIHH